MLINDLSNLNSMYNTPTGLPTPDGDLKEYPRVTSEMPHSAYALLNLRTRSFGGKIQTGPLTCISNFSNTLKDKISVNEFLETTRSALLTHLHPNPEGLSIITKMTSVEHPEFDSTTSSGNGKPPFPTKELNLVIDLSNNTNDFFLTFETGQFSEMENWHLCKKTKPILLTLLEGAILYLHRVCSCFDLGGTKMCIAGFSTGYCIFEKIIYDNAEVLSLFEQFMGNCPYFREGAQLMEVLARVRQRSEEYFQSNSVPGNQPLETETCFDIGPETLTSSLSSLSPSSGFDNNVISWVIATSGRTNDEPASLAALGENDNVFVIGAGLVGECLGERDLFFSNGTYVRSKRYTDSSGTATCLQRTESWEGAGSVSAKEEMDACVSSLMEDDDPEFKVPLLDWSSGKTTKFISAKNTFYRDPSSSQTPSQLPPPLSRSSVGAAGPTNATIEGNLQFLIALLDVAGVSAYCGAHGTMGALEEALYNYMKLLHFRKKVAIADPYDLRSGWTQNPIHSVCLDNKQFSNVNRAVSNFLFLPGVYILTKTPYGIYLLSSSLQIAMEKIVVSEGLTVMEFDCASWEEMPCCILAILSRSNDPTCHNVFQLDNRHPERAIFNWATFPSLCDGVVRHFKFQARRDAWDCVCARGVVVKEK